jgi:integration host factor subunit alpha
MTLTKARIIETVAEKNGYPKNRSAQIFETVLEIIKSTLVSGDDVLISGLASSV